MAVSIKNEGVINAIEIDPTFTIITGEMRWRASKEAGLLTVPCKILTLKPGDRFLRQMHENIHELTMNDWDTAEGLKKSAELIVPGTTKRVNRQEILAEEFGKSQKWVSEHLAILDQVGEMREGLKSGKIRHTKLRALKQISPENEKYVKELILDDTISRDALQNISRTLQRVDNAGEADVKEKIKATDWSGKKGDEVACILNEIAPLKIETVSEASNLIQKTAIQLIELLEEYPLASFGSLSSVSVVPTIMRLGNFLNEYLKGQIKLN